MKIQIETEPKEIAALIVALQERQVNCYEIAKSIQDAIQDRTELFQPLQHEVCDISKIKGITVDLASHDIPQATVTTACGAKVSIYWPRDRTEDDCKRNLERASGVLAKSLYQDIKSGSRTADEMVAQIREHIPDYEPHMIPREQVLGG